jgi:hypothetical protein
MSGTPLGFKNKITSKKLPCSFWLWLVFYSIFVCSVIVSPLTTKGYNHDDEWSGDVSVDLALKFYPVLSSLQWHIPAETGRFLKSELRRTRY